MFDAHFHLDFFAESEISDLVFAAQRAGVEGGVLAGVWLTQLENIAKLSNNLNIQAGPESVLEFVKKGDFACPNKARFSLFATAGLHPWYQEQHWLKSDGTLNAASMDRDLMRFEKLLQENSSLIWAIGETGFDLHHTSGNAKARKADMQRVAFDFCIEIAARHNLPLIVHTRNAWQLTTQKLLAQNRKTPALIHCYGGPAESFPELCSQNIFASFGGPVTWEHSNKLRNVLVRCPKEMMMLETDSPDLPPLLNGTKPPRNEPWMLSEIAKRVAEIRGENILDIVARSDKNLFRWLGIDRAF